MAVAPPAPAAAPAAALLSIQAPAPMMNLPQDVIERMREQFRAADAARAPPQQWSMQQAQARSQSRQAETIPSHGIFSESTGTRLGTSNPDSWEVFSRKPSYYLTIFPAYCISSIDAR